MREPKAAGGFFQRGRDPLCLTPGSYALLGTSPRASRPAASGGGGVVLAPDVMNQILRRAIEQRTGHKALERVLKALRELVAKLGRGVTLTSCSK
jgi:hypothetical protein